MNDTFSFKGEIIYWRPDKPVEAGWNAENVVFAWEGVDR